VSLAALGACAAQAPSSPAQEIDRSTFAFDMPGEPGQTSAGRGIIFGDRIIFRTPGSAGWYQSTIDARQEDGTTRRFRIGDMTVMVEPGGCRGNAARPDRVTTSYPPHTYRGWGGPRIVPTAIGGTTWTVRELDGQRAPDGASPAATLTFGEQGTISGTNACNDVGGGIRWRDGRFEKPENDYDLPLSTLIGCPEPSSSEFGAKFWSRMTQAQTWTRDGATLWITFTDGSRAGLALIL
jgi:heat shock protein HslJ